MSNKYCPICGEENGCMAGNADGECWCNHVEFPDEIFKLVPADSIRKHCICKRCLNNTEVKKEMTIIQNK